MSEPAPATEKAPRPWLAPAAAVGAAVLALGVGLTRFGIWEPWEMDAAEAARHWAAGEQAMSPGAPLSTWLASLGFRLFGVREWSGRLAVLIASAALLVAAYHLAKRITDRRAGLYAVLVAASSPLFIFNARQMLGAAPHMAAQAWVAIAALATLMPRTERSGIDWRAAVGLAVAVSISAFGSGVLLGPLPPLVAATAIAFAHPSARADKRAMALVGGLTTLLVLGVVSAIGMDAREYTTWLGGGARGGQPPTFEHDLTRVFHGFAPWSALFIPALGALLAPGSAFEAAADEDAAVDGDAPDPTALFLIVWFAASFAATTIYASRYGYATVYALGAAAVAVAVFVRRVELSERAWWGLGLLTALLSALMLRDYVKYPGSAVASLPASGLTLPEGAEDPKVVWAVLLGGFAVAALLGFACDPAAKSPKPGVPRAFITAQWRRGPAFKAWLILLGLVALTLVFFPIIVLVRSSAYTILAVRIARALGVVAILLPVTIVLLPRALALWGRLARFRSAPLLAVGAAFGLFVAHGYLPELSTHLSPAQLFQTYNELRGDGEALAEHQTGGRAARYYTDGEIVELGGQAEVMGYLNERTDERRWAAFPAEQLLVVNDSYRRANGRHLFVADARSARAVLATNRPIEGRENENIIARSVLREMPRRPEHPVGVRFGPAIELIGFDIDYPNDGDAVGASEQFSVTWYWRALAASPGGYRIFLHIDGHGQRLNGDHDPVEGRYAVRGWQAGDIIVDTHTLRVPATYPPGRYTFWIGFYSGNNRLPVQGVERCGGAPCMDGVNRLNAGTLLVR